MIVLNMICIGANVPRRDIQPTGPLFFVSFKPGSARLNKYGRSGVQVDG